MPQLAPFSQNQRDYYFRSKDSWLNIAEGGVRAGKNVLNVTAFCHAVEHSENRYHLAMGVSVAAALMYIIECDGFGALFHFTGRYREGTYKDWKCLYVTDTGGAEKVILIHGANDVRSERRIKGATLGCVCITEVNECDRAAVLQTFNRTKSVRDPKHFHDLNPKPEGHWYYREVLEPYSKSKGFNYGHFTIWDNYSISPETLERELEKEDKTSARYKRDILGKRVALDGLIYGMFDRDVHVVEAIPRPYSKFYVSCDYGHSNATAFLLFGEADGIYYLAEEYYHSERETGKPMTVSAYCDALEKLCGARKIECIVVDPSAKAFINEVQARRKYRVRAGANAVSAGISAVGEALQRGVVKINSCCERTIREFGLYSWNEKSFEDVPVKDNDHCMDALRYAVLTLGFAQKRKARIVIE